MHHAPSLRYGSTGISAAAHPSGAAIIDIDPYGADFLSGPYPFHAALRDAGPVVWLPRYAVFALARHAEVRASLVDAERFCSSAGLGLSNFHAEAPWRPLSPLLEADGELHKRTRRVMARILAPAAVRRLQAAFVEEAEALVDRLVARRTFDGIADLAEPYPLKVFSDAIGLSETGRENLIPYGNLTADTFGPLNERVRSAMAKAGPAIAWVAAQCRREALAPGGLGMQLHDIADTGEITRGEAELLVRALLGAGLETTVSALGNMLFCFADHPDQWQRLRAEPELLGPAIDEMFRFESPGQAFFRTTTCAVELAGAKLPAEQKVLLFLGAANRDPRQWSTPDQFDIGRRPRGHLAFGAGVHACVGHLFARLEVEAVLNALLRRVKTIERAGTPERRVSNSMRALASLPLRVGPATLD